MVVWYLYEPVEPNIQEATPKFRLKAENLISRIQDGNIEVPEVENVVEIEGVIKEINRLNGRLTVLLAGGNNESAGIICDMQSNQTNSISKFQPKDTILLKGVYKGFLKDAVFLNCVVSQGKINE